MFILHHSDAESWWPKYVKVLESRSFCKIPKPVLGSVGDKLSNGDGNNSKTCLQNENYFGNLNEALQWVVTEM